jgi:hypothetical protein
MLELAGKNIVPVKSVTESFSHAHNCFPFLLNGKLKENSNIVDMTVTGAVLKHYLGKCFSGTK